MKFIFKVLSLSLFFYVSVSSAANKEFPGRDIYLGTEHIELITFEKEFSEVIVVDVRSKYEYQTLRISGAMNIPLNSSRFISDMKQLRESNAGKKIVVYCNGKTCMKSYKAASKCKSRGITNVVAFDAGIMDWAKTHPEKAVLLGKSPIDPSKLISKSTFKEHLLAPKAFAELVNTKDVNVLDVRDRFQRSGLALFVGMEKQADLDSEETINQYIKASKAANKPLLIYDEAGKQVRWLMYRLEAQGVKDYKFLKGGTRNYFKALKAGKLRI